ncbi:MAG TPA: hypothetical protein VFC47_12735, partial [Caulobacteraceae bacterium]|nr:hypothetical protein [Caulobacteraceae bacterium]
RRPPTALLAMLGALAVGVGPPAGPTTASLVLSAGAARYMLAASPDRLLGAVDPVSWVALNRALRPGGTKIDDPLWADLVAGSVQTRRERADVGETLWFNPVFDAGLAMAWRRTSDGWIVVAAVPVLGETLRGERLAAHPLDGRVGWPHAGRSLRLALGGEASASDADAERGGWSALFGETPQARAASFLVAMARVSRARFAMRAMAHTPGYRSAIADARNALAGGEAARLATGGAARRELVSMGAAGRSTLRAVDAIRRPDGWSLVLQSPDAPGLAWFAHLSDPPDGKAARVAIVDAARLLASPSSPTNRQAMK